MFIRWLFMLGGVYRIANWISFTVQAFLFKPFILVNIIPYHIDVVLTREFKARFKEVLKHIDFTKTINQTSNLAFFLGMFVLSSSFFTINAETPGCGLKVVKLECTVVVQSICLAAPLGVLLWKLGLSYFSFSLIHEVWVAKESDLKICKFRIQSYVKSFEQSTQDTEGQRQVKKCCSTFFFLRLSLHLLQIKTTMLMTKHAP